MNPERFEALLWERIDGTISAEDRAELEDYLARDDTAAELESDVTRLAQLLQGAPRVAPPAALKERIDLALAAARPPEHGGVVSLRARSLSLRSAREWRARLLPLAAGLVLGAAIVQLLHTGGGRPVDSSRVSGAMQATPVQGLVSMTEIDLGSEIGTVTVDRDGATVCIELELVGATDVELAVAAEMGDLHLVGSQHTHSTASEASAGDGLVTLRTGGPARHRLVVVADQPTTPLRLTLTTDEGTTVERRIEPARVGVEP